MVHGHSGIGGALYLGDELYRGTGGLAGELGHVKVVPNGGLCSCGGRGCLEAYASERAMSARLLERGRNVKGIAEIADAAAHGDEIVLEILREAGRHLGFALANMINAADVRNIVLGGDLAVLADYLLPSVWEALFANVLAVVGTDVQLLVSTLGQDAVAFGGVALAMENFIPLPSRRGLKSLSTTSNAE